ncbi:hypothetical protein [Luteolibacter soli]|uniref:Uncharacterized protein n=1 Tax=Luteolibacter soli TaxID=3135280 RepID=A0ABU9ARN8_9BACT
MSGRITSTHAAAVLAFVALAGISSMRVPAKSGPESLAATASSKTHSRDDARSKRYGPPEAVQRRMEKIRQTKDPGERMRETIDLVNSLPVSELRRWLERGWFAAGDGYERKVFTLLAKERWKRDDPEGYVAWGMKHEKDGRDVLVEWARTDPERMLDFFRKHPDPMLELQLWATASNLNPGFATNRLLELAKTGGADPNFNYWPVDRLAAIIGKADSSLLEAHLGDLPVEWRGKVQGAIVAARLQKDFPGEVARLAEMPDGWKLMETARQNMEGFSLRVLDAVADFPPAWKASMVENAAAFVNDPRWVDADIEGLGFTAEQARTIRAQAMRMAVYSSPERVLGSLHEADLTEEQRKSVLGSLFHPGSDPTQMAGMLANLKSFELRQLAESMMVPPANEAAGVAESAEVPPKAQGSWMEQAAEQGGSQFIFMQSLANWNSETEASMIADFKALPEEKKRHAAKVIVGGQEYVSDVEASRAMSGEAIRYLLAEGVSVASSEKPVTEDTPWTQAALHAARWVQEDPLAASQWVLTLPPGEPRDKAIQLLTTTWNRYDPDAAGKWVQGLPSGDREKVKAGK